MRYSLSFLLLITLTLLITTPLGTVNGDFTNSLKQFASKIESVFKHHNHHHHHHDNSEHPIVDTQLNTALTNALTTSIQQDYPDCNTTVVNTTDHILNVTISFIEKKCSNDSLPEKAKKICTFLTAHEEGVKGFLVGFFDLYLLSYFYAAGAGKCDIHPFNTSNTNLPWDSYIHPLASADVYDGYASFIRKAGIKHSADVDTELFMQLSEEHEHEHHEDHDDKAGTVIDRTRGDSGSDVMAIEHYQRPAGKKLDRRDDDHDGDHKKHHSHHDGGHGRREHDDDDDDDDPEKDKKRCERCYGKVVGKYIETVLKIGKKVCNETKCDYVKRVCEYLESHKEYTVGLIIGGLSPFKFAAGYCMGAKQCRPQPRPHLQLDGVAHAHTPMKMNKEFMYGSGGHDMMIKTMMKVAQHFV